MVACLCPAAQNHSTTRSLKTVHTVLAVLQSHQDDLEEVQGSAALAEVELAVSPAGRHLHTGLCTCACVCCLCLLPPHRCSQPAASFRLCGCCVLPRGCCLPCTCCGRQGSTHPSATLWVHAALQDGRRVLEALAPIAELDREIRWGGSACRKACGAWWQRSMWLGDWAAGSQVLPGWLPAQPCLPARCPARLPVATGRGRLRWRR